MGKSLAIVKQPENTEKRSLITTVPRWWPEVLAAGMNASIGIEFSADYVENIKLAVLYGGARYSLLPHPDLSPVPLKNPLPDLKIKMK